MHKRVFLSLDPKKLMRDERWHQNVIHPVPSWWVFPPIFNVCQNIIKIVLIGHDLLKILQSCSGYHKEFPHGFHLSTPVKSPNADPSVSGPHPFISVPMHPRKDMIMCIAPGLRVAVFFFCVSHLPLRPPLGSRRGKKKNAADPLIFIPPNKKKTMISISDQK